MERQRQTEKMDENGGLTFFSHSSQTAHIILKGRENNHNHYSILDYVQEAKFHR